MVRGGGEPLGEFVDVLARQPAVAVLAGEFENRRRTQPAVEVIVEQDLRRQPAVVEGDRGRTTVTTDGWIADDWGYDSARDHAPTVAPISTRRSPRVRAPTAEPERIQSLQAGPTVPTHRIEEPFMTISSAPPPTLAAVVSVSAKQVTDNLGPVVGAIASWGALLLLVNTAITLLTGGTVDYAAGETPSAYSSLVSSLTLGLLASVIVSCTVTGFLRISAPEPPGSPISSRRPRSSRSLPSW